MKCDLHVHTVHSGMCTVPLLNRVCRESYSNPADVYNVLKERGMDLVTVTDHDCIDASEKLRRYPDFFLSEEVSCTLPSGTLLHVNVLDIQERDHTELQRRRCDFGAFLAYVQEQELFFAVNHPYSGLTGNRTEADFALFAHVFPAIETRNGQLMRTANRAASCFAAQWGKTETAGSDAHTLRSLASTYSEVPGAKSKRDFLAGLRAGRSHVRGEHGSYWKLASALYRVAADMAIRSRWTGLTLSPLMTALPAAALATCIRDLVFASAWRYRTSARPSRAMVRAYRELAS